MMKEPDNARALLLALKRHNPFKVRVFASDSEGDHRDVAVPTRRRKWASVIEAIEARAWTRCVMMDKSGAELGYATNEAGGGELEDISAQLPAGTGGQLMLAERIVSMVTRAQRDALTFRDKETAALLAAQGAVVSEMTQAVRGLAEVYREQMLATSEVGDARVAAQQALAAASDAEGGGDWGELLKALPTVLQALPLLKAMVMQAPPAAPPPITVNGVNKH